MDLHYVARTLLACALTSFCGIAAGAAPGQVDPRPLGSDDLIFVDSFEAPASTSLFGTLYTVDGLASDGSAGFVHDVHASNHSLYFNVLMADGEPRVVQLDPDGPSPTWRDWTDPDWQVLWSARPTSPAFESEDQFRVFFHALETYGFITMNSGDIPADMQDPVPEDAFGNSPDHMVLDHSSIGAVWAAFYDGDTTTLAALAHFPDFEPVASLAGMIDVIEADPSEPMVWVAIGDTVHEVTINGDVTSHALPAATDGGIVTKLRFAGSDAYALVGAHIVRITPGGGAQLFHTFALPGGDFAIGSGYLYTGAGDVVRLSDGVVVANMIPPAPAPDTPAHIADAYWENRSLFQAGRLEILNDPLASSIFAVAGARVLQVPLDLFPESH